MTDLDDAAVLRAADPGDMLGTVVALADRPLSEVLAPFRRYAASGEVNTRVDDALGKIEEIARAYRDGRQDRTDGLTVEFDDWWFNVRPSNTEPLLRLNVEARTEELLREKTEEVLALIRPEGGTS